MKNKLKITCLVYKIKLLKMFYKILSISLLAEDTQMKLICTGNQLLFSKSLELFKITFISTSSIINIKQWATSTDALPG